VTHPCPGCSSRVELGFEFSMAFQPIIDVTRAKVWGYEALVRGIAGEGATEVLAKVTEDGRYRFDQACRVKAIELAAQLFPPGESIKLSINFLPNSVYEPAACLQATFTAARKSAFPLEDIMFELTENEAVRDTDHLRAIILEYRKRGFTTAIDDFGSGHAGLGLLCDFQPDLIKLDIQLIRGIDTSRARQVILAGMLHIARELNITVLAEGVETEAEFVLLKAAGVRLFQGFWFARPAFEALPAVEHFCIPGRQSAA